MSEGPKCEAEEREGRWVWAKGSGELCKLSPSGVRGGALSANTFLSIHSEFIQWGRRYRVVRVLPLSQFGNQLRLLSPVDGSGETTSTTVYLFYGDDIRVASRSVFSVMFASSLIILDYSLPEDDCWSERCLVTVNITVVKRRWTTTVDNYNIYVFFLNSYVLQCIQFSRTVAHRGSADAFHCVFVSSYSSHQ